MAAFCRRGAPMAEKSSEFKFLVDEQVEGGGGEGKRE